ncbi:PREDICTED: cytochrome P450 [Prunus dulcis]|uniref:PREDICTED: cytochrome P450 n=1 Tax=Prunus dulcis TaxID=3755 RepID=A0A5E4E886_PRUDU|nr:PREDICTED: cytochrome P450 [Prunus dulcis]
MEEPFWYNLALIIFTLLLKLSIAKITRKHNFPPSPPSLPIIGHLHLLKQPIHRTLQALSGKFGKLRLLRWGSRRVLLVSSPWVAEELFTKHDIIFANRPRLLIGKHLAYDFTTVTLAPYGDLWRNLRRIMTL